MEQQLDLEKELWTEAQLIELLGITRDQLDNLRRDKGLPFVSLGQRTRVYLASEIFAWLKNGRG